MTTTMHEGSRTTPAGEAGADLFEAFGGAVRIAEIAVVALVGLLVCPPLLILAVVVAVPLIATAALVAAVVGAIAVPAILVRRVRAHHRRHGSTLFLHRLWPRRPASGGTTP